MATRAIWYRDGAGAIGTRGEAASAAAIGGGAVAGAIGGVAMSTVAMIVSWAMGAGLWLPTKNIAAMFYGAEALVAGADAILVGVMIHMVVSALFGALFGLVVGKSWTALGALMAGLVWGVIIWAGMTFVGLPLVNETMSQRVALQPVWWFGYHLIFGAMLFLTPMLAAAFAGERVRREGPAPVI